MSKFKINDRLGINTLPKCGWAECKNSAETGYGQCIEHLVKGMYRCLYCGKLYPENDNPNVCSERCDELLDRAVDEARGK